MANSLGGENQGRKGPLGGRKNVYVLRGLVKGLLPFGGFLGKLRRRENEESTERNSKIE